MDSYTLKQETARIIDEYARRREEIPSDYYSFFKAGILFTYQQRVRAVIDGLHRAGISQLRDRSILEIGCGRGDWLVDLETWGAQRKNLAGIELQPDRGEAARGRLADRRDLGGEILSKGADVQIGDA